MKGIDWLVIAVYLALVIGISLWFSRRALRSAEDYLVAGRRLPWWVIGFSDVASAAGADAFWILVISSGAFIALHRFFWIAAVIGLPIGVIWARYWRRLRLLSPGQLFEERYGGLAAGRFRGFFALYGALFTSCLILAYVLQGFAQIMAPFLDWPQDTVLAVFCGVSVLYTMISGLLGVAYSDVLQFLLLMLGRVLLAAAVVGACGGLEALLDGVEALKGPEFLQPYPPASGPLFGEAWSVEPMSLVALILMGFFAIAGTQSSAVQRALAARSEADAAFGRMFNALLTLVLRVAPLLLIGLGGMLLFQETPAVDLWTETVKRFAGPGLLGLILVGVVAGYMSTIDTFLNFMTAGLFNDLYKRHIRPQAKPREQLIFLRLATVAVMGFAYLWARVLVGTIDADWLNFMNSVIGLFILPLALLRWIWWRINIWAEIFAYVMGVPLAYLVWFVMGFNERPYWQAFFLLFGLGWVLILSVTLLTRPEDPQRLQDFYERVRPPGFWGPIRARLPEALRQRDRAALKLDLAAIAAGLIFCEGAILSLSAGLARRWELLALAGTMFLLGGIAFFHFTLKGNRSEMSPDKPRREEKDALAL